MTKQFSYVDHAKGILAAQRILERSENALREEYGRTSADSRDRLYVAFTRAHRSILYLQGQWWELLTSMGELGKGGK